MSCTRTVQAQLCQRNAGSHFYAAIRQKPLRSVLSVGGSAEQSYAVELCNPAVEHHPYRGSVGKGKGPTSSPCQVPWGDLPLVLPLSCSVSWLSSVHGLPKQSAFAQQCRKQELLQAVWVGLRSSLCSSSWFRGCPSLGVWWQLSPFLPRIYSMFVCSSWKTLKASGQWEHGP